ncbi:MAG: alpha-amylase family glycosyl hydrolase, partial [Verrucomicrobiota bacterium]
LTFDAAIERLPDLVDLGITAIEVMPVAQFPGSRNWGYDGVFLFATQNSYGGPAAFQRFIDASHGHGIAVFLDVVFNHLGPEGNYLSQFAPYFTPRSPTPWGPGFRFDGKDSGPVREFFLDCVFHWIHDFRLDGLRLDAVHVIKDSSDPHVLTEIQDIANKAAEARNGTTTIIAESLQNDPRIVTSVGAGGLGLDAEWNEDFHHALSAKLTGERQGKYIDYDEPSAIARVFRENTHLSGQDSRYYERPWGVPSHHIDPSRYVISLQNHDHIGNRARGERLASLVDERHLSLGACLTILSPFLPMVFMGEEYGETNPFLFFCSFDDPRVIKGVREGRKRDYELEGEIPDPQNPASFQASRLSRDWSSPSQTRLRTLYRELICLRKEIPEIATFRRRSVSFNSEDPSPILTLQRDKLITLFHFGKDKVPLGEQNVTWRSSGLDEDKKEILLQPLETLLYYEGSQSGNRT